MDSPREIEIKFTTPAEAWPQLKRSLPIRRGRAGKSTRLVSVYFDTHKCDLHKSGVSLRVRRNGRHRLQTIKAEEANSLSTRGEWEREVRSDTPDLQAAQDTPAAKLLSKKKIQHRIRPVFETRVNRIVYPIKLGESMIEVAFDQGEIDSGRESSPLCEVELELKQGRPDDLFRLAKTLAEKVPVELALASKAERGYRLLSGDGESAVKAAPVALRPDTPASQAFQAIAHACLVQLVENLPALRKGDSEALHQARVALRRLRAATSLFADVVRNQQTEGIKSELKWITSEFGPAREMDVLWERADATSKETHALDADAELDGLPALEDELAQRRQRAFRRARAAVESTRFRMLLIDVAAWIEVGAWLRTDDPLRRLQCETAIERLAATELDRCWKKILKRGRKLRGLDPRRRHKLRIAVKKIRYASEFFAGVFPGAKSNRRQTVFLKRLKPVQDCLGELNDITVHQHLTSEFAAEPAHGPRRKGGENTAFAAGLLSGHEQARLADVLDAADRAFRRCEEVKPYW
ncbi:MAG: CHAD domain-containing protein [Xanthobacteraceae bacterium]|nr:CHAD domain-containing protein [Xanthobacteraceae bacterium]